MTEHEEWNGTERRAVALADERTRSNGSTVEVPVAVVVIGFACVAILQAAGLIGHAVLSGHIDREAQRSKAVDASLTCYVVKVTQGQDVGPGILIDCGFLNPPGVNRP